MPKIPLSIQKAIRRNEEIEMDGRTFYPIRVEEMDAFMTARASIEFMQQTLPAKYAVMPILEAYFAYDMDAAMEKKQPSGLFSGALLFLALSLRIGRGLEVAERLRQFKIITDRTQPNKLKSICVSIDGEEIINITSENFTKWRAVLAAQNGLILPDESASAELLEAKRDIDSQNAPKLNVDFDILLTAMSLITGKDENEIMDWPVKKFFGTKPAADRLIHHIVYGIGEMSGNIKWKNGNPCPSWCYDRIENESAAFDSISRFTNGAAKSKN